MQRTQHEIKRQAEQLISNPLPDASRVKGTSRISLNRRSVVRNTAWAAPIIAVSMVAPNAAASVQPAIRTTVTVDVWEAGISLNGKRTGNNVTLTDTATSSSIADVQLELFVNVEGRADHDPAPPLNWRRVPSSNWSTPIDGGEVTIHGYRARRFIIRYQGPLNPGRPDTVLTTDDLELESVPTGGSAVRVAIMSKVVIDGRQVMGAPSRFEVFRGLDPSYEAQSGPSDRPGRSRRSLGKRYRRPLAQDVTLSG